MYFVYILKCRDGALYTGFTTDPKRREGEHRSGKGGHYTRAHKGGTIVYTERCATRSAALKREAEIKNWPRNKKLALIEPHGTRTKRDI